MEHMGDMEGVAIVMEHMEHTKHTEDLGIDTADMGAALATEAMADMEDPRVRRDAQTWRPWRSGLDSRLLGR